MTNRSLSPIIAGVKFKALPWLTHRWQDGLLFLVLVAGGLALAALPLTLAGLAVVGGTVVVATLVRPQIGLYLLIFAVPFGSLREISLGGMTVGATEALIGLMLAAWLARLLAYPQGTLRWPPLTLPLLIFLAAALLSLPGALSLRYSLKELIKWIEVLGLYVLAANVLDRRRARTLVFCILLAGTASALHGWYQFFTRSGPEGFLLYGRFMRAYGTFEQPNPYAGYLGLIAPLALSLALAGWPFSPFKGEGAKGGGLVKLLFYGGALVTMVAAVAMSRSRGAWLGFALAAAAVIAARSRWGAVALAVVGGLGLALGSLPSAPQALAQPLTDLLPYVRPFDVRGVEVTDANFAVVERMAHWQAGWWMWAEHPWRGVGIGNYEPVYPAYYIPPWKEPLGHAHNTYLNVAAETGLIGLLAYLALWGVAFWQTARAIRHTSGWERAASVGVLGVLVHLSAHNFFDNLFVHNMYAHVAILLGMLPALTDVTTHRENDATS